MIIRSIEVSNLGPFLGDWRVELGEGVTAFVGEYEGAETSSNRSGKSYVAVDVPRYVLHGVFRGSTIDRLPHRKAAGVEDAVARMTVDNSLGTRFELARGRSAGGNPIREVDGREVSESDFEDLVVREILGLSEVEHRLTTTLVQGGIGEFMEMTAANKRRVVSPWFRTDRWVPRADLARKRLGRTKSRLSNLRTRLDEIGDPDVDTLVELLEVASKDVEVARKIVAERRVDVETAEKTKRDLAVRIVEFRDLANEKLRLSRELDDERETAERAVRDSFAAVDKLAREVDAVGYRASKIEELERFVAGSTAANDLVDAISGDIRRRNAVVGESEEERRRLGETYRTLSEERTGVCPVLGEPCDRVDANSADLPALKTRGLVLLRKRDRARREIDRLTFKLGNAEADVAQITDARAELERLRSMPSRREIAGAVERAKEVALEARRRAKRVDGGRSPTAVELALVEARLAAAPELDDERIVLDLADARSKLRGYEDIARSAEATRDARSADLARARAEVAERARIETEIAAACRELELLTWTSYAFGATGIPSRELENAFGVAEDEMNIVLEDIRTPLRVAFAPDRELKDWEAACLACGSKFEKGERKHVCLECGAPRRKRRRDELALGVVDRGNDSEYELDSGGGKVMISLGVRLGLARLPAASRKVSCQNLTVDEADAALDEPNRRRLHAALRNVERVGIRQVFLITHADVRREFENVVVVHRWDEEDRSGVWNDE